MVKTQNLGYVVAQPKGAWQNNVTYPPLSIVRNESNGTVYMAIVASNNVQPGVTTGWENVWMKLTSDGINGGGTTVTVGGVAQTTWNADTKLDKVTTTTDLPQIYMKNQAGGQVMQNVDDGRTAPWNFLQLFPNTYGGTEPQSDGRVVQRDPELPYQVSNKKYVDEQIANAGGGKYLHTINCMPNAVFGGKGYTILIVNSQSTPYSSATELMASTDLTYPAFGRIGDNSEYNVLSIAFTGSYSGVELKVINSGGIISYLSIADPDGIGTIVDIPQQL